MKVFPIEPLKGYGVGSCTAVTWDQQFGLELLVRVPTKLMQVLKMSSSLKCSHTPSGLDAPVTAGAPCQAPHPPPALGEGSHGALPSKDTLLFCPPADFGAEKHWFHVTLSSASYLLHPSNGHL